PCQVAETRVASVFIVRQVFVHAELAGIGVFADFDRCQRAHRQVAHFGVAGIDDLVCGFRAAGGAGDDVALPQRVMPVAVAKFTVALEDEEHFLFRAMAVERTIALARRDYGEVVAELARADATGNLGPAKVVLRGVFAPGRAFCPDRLHFEVGKVDHGILHASSPASRVRGSPFRWCGSRARQGVAYRRRSWLLENRCDRASLHSSSHGGACFSRNADKPSWPSVDTRRRAISQAFSASTRSADSVVMPDVRSARSLASCCASGPPLARKCNWPSIASSSRSKISALTNSRRAWRSPMACTTYGAIVAGTRPSFTSLSANFAPSMPTATSQQAISPTPPP